VQVPTPYSAGTFFGFMSTAMVCIVSILTNTMQKTHEVGLYTMHSLDL
jgi:hypothetical protein